MNNLYEIAKKYREFGWNVLPLVNYEKGKVPNSETSVGFGWIKWQHQKPTNEEFEKLFKAKNITGLALMTGETSNITVVDYDSYSKNAPVLNINSTLYSKTASGGTHYYFQYCPDIEEQRTEGMEIKNQTIIVLPPSQVHNKQGEIGKYEWVKKGKPPVFPKEILSFFKPKSYIPKSLTELFSSGQGTRHHSFLSAANKIFLKLDEEDWMLGEEFLRNNLDKFDPPYNIGHSPQDVDNVIRDAKIFAKEHKNPDYINRYTVSEESEEENIPEPVSLKQAAEERILERVQERNAPKTGYKELDEAISGWTPGFVYVLAGDTGVGKTALACNFAKRVSNQNKQVLYYSIETGNEILDSMASVSLNKPYSSVTDEDISFDDPNIKLYRDEVLTLPRLIKSIEQNKTKFDLAIIDNIGFFEEKSNTPTQAQHDLMRELSKLGLKTRMAILIIAHFNKPPPGGKNIVSMDRISGSKAFQDFAKGVLLLKRNKISEDPDETRYTDNGLLIVGKSKRGAQNKFRLHFANKSANVKSDLDFPISSLEGNGF